MTELERRLTNWGDAWRHRKGLDGDGQAASFEGIYRSPQRKHWDSDFRVGIAPVAPVPIDILDALEIERAVCLLDFFHHALLRAWYVQGNSASGALIAARAAAAWRQVKQSRLEAAHELDARLVVAQCLLGALLTLPAVVRKERAKAYVRGSLGEDPLTELDDGLTIRATIRTA